MVSERTKLGSVGTDGINTEQTLANNRGHGSSRRLADSDSGLEHVAAMKSQIGFLRIGKRTGAELPACGHPEVRQLILGYKCRLQELPVVGEREETLVE